MLRFISSQLHVESKAQLSSNLLTLTFLGGNPHFGANGLSAGPCVALFHGCEQP